MGRQAPDDCCDHDALAAAVTEGHSRGGQLVIRPAHPGDVGVMLELVRALADYEQAADRVVASDAHLHHALFGPAPKVFAHVAEHGAAVVGMAIWFVNFSTWTGQHGIYLEDLFVRPSARNLGAGKALLSALARLAVDRGYARVEWAVLDWNEPAIGFYHHLGARAQDEWTTFRLSGAALDALAGR